ncbi:hypothetical protein [Effusibacillus pohliae]|uniref:hypothetical protein n=1 Tax=Effusibacillus pohliae TaxID=232270 RepID=UPI000370C374|nr:hypothetical protein [Effusibacillus pohliae]
MRTFVTEPVVLAMFGELLQPLQPVRYLLPYSTVQELPLLVNENLSADAAEQATIRANIERLIRFFENPFVRKQAESCLTAPWAVSKPILYNQQVTFQVVNAVDTAAYGETFDPIETELIVLAVKENVPLLTEEPSLQARIVDAEIPVQVFDVSDFEFALEEELPGHSRETEPATRRNRTFANALPAIIFGGFLLILLTALIMTFFL